MKRERVSVEGGGHVQIYAIRCNDLQDGGQDALLCSDLGHEAGSRSAVDDRMWPRQTLRIWSSPAFWMLGSAL